MFRIKICGITRLEDAQYVQTAGADALGFIFCTSLRRVEVEQVKEITSGIGEAILRVGVFRNQDPGWINSIVQGCGLNLVQLHGEEPPEFLETIKVPCIKVLSAKESLSKLEMVWTQSKAIAILLDNGGGGTGKVFDWKCFQAYRALGKPLILAGGLSPVNVEEAILTLNPDGVDTSSGVENEPGIKERKKIKEFTAAAQRGFRYVQSESVLN